jgi:flavin reductase (DIM6/NTAB) family NADH-FMN oxidoreductase RutF
MDSAVAAVLGSLTTGIYVLTVADGDNHHGMSSSWVTQVSGDPPLLMAAVDVQHFSGQVIARTGVFGLNLVGHRGKHLEDYFLSPASRHQDNLREVRYEASPSLGVPWLKDALASIEARVVNSVIAGDHRLMIAEPVGVRVNQGDRPLTSLDLDYVYVGGRNVIARDRSGW